MPEYTHLCNNCNEEFDDTYSIHSPPPDTCPLCGCIGKVKRLISGMPSVKMILQGQELKQHIKDENKKNQHKFKTDEKFKANVIGETKYEASIKESERINNRYKDV